MTPLETFKLELLTSFIGYTNNLNIRTKLLTDALNFVRNENSGCSAVTDEDIENLKVLYNFVDEDSDLANSMHKVLVLLQDIPTDAKTVEKNPNEGLVTWGYNLNNKIDDVKKSVIIRRATKDDNEENCYNNVGLIFKQLIGEGVIGFDVEEGLEWK